MSDILCSYHDREAVLMAYLYEEISPSARESFEAHLTTCARCRVELNGLSGVRGQLAQWAPPDYRSHESQVASRKSEATSRKSKGSSSDSLIAIGSASRDPQRAATGDEQAAHEGQRSFWRDIPTWAQVAAAMVVLGISAGAANLNIHYDAQTGLNIRTGWSNRGSEGVRGSQGSSGSQVSLTSSADVVNHGELTALEQRLRGEIHATSAPVAAHAASTSSDADTIRRVRALLDETERRHERELALKVAEVMRDVNMQRQSDLRKIDQNIDQGRVEVLRNRQMLDYYMQRASQRQ